MATYKMTRPKWRGKHTSEITQFAYDRMYEIVQARLEKLLEQAGGDWNTVVNDHTLDLLNYDDCLQLDRDLLAQLGRKYVAGAEISALEEPDRYTV